MVFEDLKDGSVAVLKGYKKGNAQFRKKLMAMGLTEGTELKVVRKAPLGDPVEIEIRGFLLTLRKTEAEMLILKEV